MTDNENRMQRRIFGPRSTLIRPIVTYASETWVLKESMIKKLIYLKEKS